MMVNKCCNQNNQNPLSDIPLLVFHKINPAVGLRQLLWTYPAAIHSWHLIPRVILQECTKRREAWPWFSIVPMTISVMKIISRRSMCDVIKRGMMKLLLSLVLMKCHLCLIFVKPARFVSALDGCPYSGKLCGIDLLMSLLIHFTNLDNLQKYRKTPCGIFNYSLCSQVVL